jgi:RNA polymerase sigma-70 factor (ECF subfamily)
LQRARATLQEKRPPRRPQNPEQNRLLVEQYVAATERSDAHAIAQLLREDVRFSMPPEVGVYAGRDVVVNSWIEGGFGSPPYDDFRCFVTRANRMPAVACYVRKPGDTEHRPFAIDVLQIEDGVITEITGFDVSSSFAAFGLPATL